MNSGLILAVYGILVSWLSFLFFTLLGIVCLPRKSHGIGLSAFPTFTGLALFSLVCWYGIANDISLYIIFQSLVGVTFILFCIRIKYSLNIIKNLLRRHSLYWLFAYLLFYFLVYFFLPLPDLKKYLPLTWTYNVDIFNYINVTQNLITPTENWSYMLSYYHQNPAVYCFFAWTSLFYQNNAMMATMPLLYSVVAILGLMITFYCYHFFHCPRKIAVCIAAVVLCGSFYRYIIDMYFLSSLMGTVIWLAFLTEILHWDIDERYFWRYTLVILVYQGLLLFVYPVFFVCNLVIFCIVVGLLFFFSVKNFSWRDFMKQELFFVGCLVLSTLVLIAAFPQHIAHVVHDLFEFVHRKEMLGLSLLSPVAMLGFPSFFQEIYMPLTCAFILFVAAFLYALRLAKLYISPAAYVLLCLLVGAFCVYFLYYGIEGPTRYQPWKFASYFILPLMGVLWALAFRLKPSTKGFISLMLFFIVGNFFWVPIHHQPPLKNNYQNLALLNALPERDLYVKMSTPEAAFLTMFYVSDKHLFLLSPSFYYYPRTRIQDVPKNAQVFIESHDCSSDEVKFGVLGCIIKEYEKIRLTS